MALALPLALHSSPALAGTQGVLTVEWDANTSDADLSGYLVYLSTDPGVYSLPPALARASADTRALGNTVTSTTFTGLDTTQVYHLAVTCLDYSGNESGFSNVVSAPPRTIPILSTVSPASATQGAASLDVTLAGADFLPGATVSFGPGVTTGALDDSGAPSRLVARVDVDPLAQVDMRDVVVTNPGNASITKSGGFAVRLNVARVDVNLSNRIDGGDMIAMAAAFSAREGEPAYSVALDLNVDGLVDGTDLSLLIQYFGRVGPF